METQMELPFEKELVAALRTPGSHLMVMNNLPDSDNAVAEAISLKLQERMNDFSKEIEKLSVETGVTIIVKTLVSFTKGINNNG